MNYISERHEYVSRMIGNPEVLSQPEKFFGPNYKTLLNFWIYWESLTGNQKYTYFLKPIPADSFSHLSLHSRLITDVINITDYAFYCIELEIIGAHNIINSSDRLIFLPLLENL
jgi:hypothetical protein